MAITVSGAGDAAYNGIYSDNGTTHNGLIVYVIAGGGRYLFNNLHAGWSLGTVVNDTSTPDYYGGGSGANPNSAAGIYAGGDTAPAPTVTGYSGGGQPMSDVFTPAGEVFEGAFLSPETSRGVLPGSPTFYALQPLTMELQPMKPINDVDANGSVVSVGVTSEKEWTEADFSMVGCVNEVVFIWAGMLCTPYVAQDATHAGVYYWIFRPRITNPDTFQSYTAVEGQTLGASGAPGISPNTFDLSMDDKKIDIKSKGFGQVHSDTVSAPNAPTFIPFIPLSVDGIDVYVADTYAGIDAGHLQDCYGEKLTISERQGTLMTHDSSVSTFSATVQKKVKATAQIIVDKVSQAATYMAKLRAKAKAYARYKLSGPQIGATGINYMVQATFPFHFVNSKRAAQNDAVAATFDMSIFADPTFLSGAWLDAVVVTDMSPAMCGITTQAGGGAIPTAANLAAAIAAATEG